MMQGMLQFYGSPGWSDFKVWTGTEAEKQGFYNGLLLAETGQRRIITFK